MRYRRMRNRGGTYFFTVVTRGRRSLFRDSRNVAHLREALRYAKKSRAFDVEAFVLLPEHLHCLWRLPPDDDNFSTRWRLVKTRFTSLAGIAGRPYWQNRFWEHLIRDEADYAVHCDYIHYNPVKHGLASSPGEWPHSTFARFVADGRYPPDWGGNPDEGAVTGLEWD